jgi:hypothetical protein
MIRRLVCLSLLLLLVPGLIAAGSGCAARKDAPGSPATAEDSLAAWRGRADSLDAALGSLEQVRGQLEQATGTSGYSAWFEDGDVRVVHEEMTLGPRGSKSNRYYFERGALRLALEAGMVHADTSARLVPLERAVLFDDSGRLVAASKSLDGVKTWVAGYEAAAALGHAQTLREAARDARPRTGAAAPPEGGTPATR